MPLTLQFSLDLALIARCFAALIWGILYAIFLQHTRWGQFLAKRRTWITVTIGIGVDLLIAFDGTWATVAAVIGLSSLGIVARSLINEEREEFNPRGYKVKWGLEDAIALSNELVEMLEGEGNARLLSLAYRINEKVKSARRGEYEQKFK